MAQERLSVVQRSLMVPGSPGFVESLKDLNAKWQTEEGVWDMEVGDGRVEHVNVLRTPDPEATETVIYLSGHPACVMPGALTMRAIAQETNATTILIDATSGSSAPSHHYSPDELAAIRPAESEAFAKNLGLNVYANLDLLDGELEYTYTDLARSLMGLQRVFNGTTLITHPNNEREYHADHDQLNRAVKGVFMNARNNVGDPSIVGRSHDDHRIPSLYFVDAPNLRLNTGQYAPVGILVGFTPEEAESKGELFAELFGSQAAKKPANGIRTFKEQTVFHLAVRGDQHGKGYWYAEGFTQHFSAGDKAAGRLQDGLLRRRTRVIPAA